MPHLFVLGRESELSLAELTQVLRADNTWFEAIAGSNELAVFDVSEFTTETFHRCGGLIKFGPAKEYARPDLDQQVQALVESRLPKQGRLTFGISVYPASPDVTRKVLADVQEQMRLLGMTIKSNLKARGMSVRFVMAGDEPQLSSVTVDKNKLTSEKGIEVLVGFDLKTVWVGATQAVQDYEAFAHRDMNRPKRDDVAGMLPPKLARTMINLAGVRLNQQSVVLDPFCGSGTVMQEALVLGAGKVLGSDASDTAVSAAQANMEWLHTQMPLLGEARVEQVDVSDIGTWLPEGFVDLAVTEPFLGDPVRKAIRKEEAIKRQAELSELYDKAFESLARVVKPNGRLVMIFPVLDDRRIPLPPAMGKRWRVLTPWIDVFTTTSKRGGLDYQRPGQRVAREIFLLERK